MDEEVVLLEEQLSAAQSDIEQLQARLADAEARETQGNAELSELRRQIEVQEASLAAQSDELETLQASVVQAQAQAGEAAARYRQVVLEREPDLPADLVQGETVAELDKSVSRARQTVAQVRQHLEQQAQTQRVPAGAPVRGAQDVSGMTATEKIRLGLRQT